MKRLGFSILGVTIAEIVFWLLVAIASVVINEFAPHLEWHNSDYLWWESAFLFLL